MRILLLSSFLAGFVAASQAASAAEVFAPDPLVPIYEGLGYAGKDDPKSEIRLAGVRGGSFSGQAVVVMKEPGKGPEATVSELKSKDGNSVIPASAIEVRYAQPEAMRSFRGKAQPANYGRVFDSLDAKPLDSGSIHPVWITVNVPPTAAAGAYEGKLTVAGRDVPIKLSVADWALPKPSDFQTWVDFIQSPESVALRYGVEPWSERHWELMDKSFAQLARVGNKTVYVELIRRTNLGNEQGMVRWVRTKPAAAGGADGAVPTWQPDGDYRIDFSIVDRYLDLAEKHFGKAPMVCFYVWDVFLGGGGFGKEGDPNDTRIPVSLYDEEKKQVVPFEGPAYADPNAEKFWRPVADGLLERMKKRGMEKSLMLGMGCDVRPKTAIVELWKKLLPDAPWVLQTHGLEGALHGVPVGYCTTVWKAVFPSTTYLTKKCGGDVEKARMHGWQRQQQVGCYARDIGLFPYLSQLLHGRLLGEMNIAGRQRGFGRMSADFWPCIKDAKGQLTHGVSARYPESNWSQLNLRMRPFLTPGPNGAEPTVRFLMLMEGVQECEAVISIDKALVDKDARARLGEALARKCQGLIDERTKALMTFQDEYGTGAESFSQSGWRERSAALYAAAAEVAAKLKAVASR